MSDYGKKGKTEVREVSFEPAMGGVVSTTRTVTKRGGQGGGPLEDYDHKKAVHATLEDAHVHLKSMMGHCFKGGDKDADGE